MRKLWVSLMVGIGIVMLCGVASLGKGSTRGRKREGDTEEREPRQEEHKHLGPGPLAGDEVGQRLRLIWQAAGGEISQAELARQLGVTERRAGEYIKNYR